MMEWYRGYIEGAGNIAIGAKREDGIYQKIDNQIVFINPNAGIGIKIERHENKKLEKMITTRQMYGLGGTDNDFYLFEDTKPCSFKDVLKA